MVRPALTVLALSVMVTALALVVLTIGGSSPVVLLWSLWSLWSLWGVAVIGGGIVYLIAHRTGRF